jgi:hypothetical protein
MPPSALIIPSPSESEAQASRTKSTTWKGSTVPFTEPGEDTEPLPWWHRWSRPPPRQEVPSKKNSTLTTQCVRVFPLSRGGCSEACRKPDTRSRRPCRAGSSIHEAGITHCGLLWRRRCSCHTDDSPAEYTSRDGYLSRTDMGNWACEFGSLSRWIEPVRVRIVAPTPPT